MYGDQAVSTEEYKKATYDNLMKTQSEEKDEVKCIDDYNQSDAPINIRSTVNSINESTSEVQRLMDDDSKNKSRKAWTMEMLMNERQYLCEYDKWSRIDE